MGACRAWRDGAASDSCPSIWWRCRGSAAGSPWSNCGDGWRIGQPTVRVKPGFGPRLFIEPAFGDRIVRKRLKRLHDCQPLPTHAPRALLRHCSASRFKCPRVRLLHDARPLRKRFFALHSGFRSWPGVWQLPQMIADAPPATPTEESGLSGRNPVPARLGPSAPGQEPAPEPPSRSRPPPCEAHCPVHPPGNHRLEQIHAALSWLQLGTAFGTRQHACPCRDA